MIHESRNLKQARPEGQYVDLLRAGRACYSLIGKIFTILANREIFVNNFPPVSSFYINSSAMELYVRENHACMIFRAGSSMS